jgi:RNA polymerase sigma-B factor
MTTIAPSAPTADLHRYAARRDAAARERLVRSYLPLAASLARRYDRGTVPFDDLQQVASIGLLKAIDRFDPGKGVAFSTFAVPTIQGELRRHFRDHSWAVRPPRDLQERAIRIERVRDELTTALGRSPAAAELAERLGCTAEEIIEASEAMSARATTSFDAPTPGDDEERTLGERLGVEEVGFAQTEAAATADHLLARLTDCQRLAVQLRFREDMTQIAIGRELGCSQMQVSRILRSALARLRREAGVTAADPPARRSPTSRRASG